MILDNTELKIKPIEAKDREMPNAVLMVTPDNFSVEYEINVHMDGNIGQVDLAAAKQQWDNIIAVYKALDVPVELIQSSPNMPDQIFSANYGIINKRGDEVTIIPSRMMSEHRQPEIPIFVDWAKQQGYTVKELSQDSDFMFEGMGDVLLHPKREFFYGGYGTRTTKETLAKIEGLMGIPLVALELVDPRWYHLDTALSPLTESLAMIVPQAFTETGRSLIKECFETVIEIPEDEGVLFAANCYTPDGKNIIMQKGCTTTKANLEKAGFIVHEVETSEFLKAGGSVFCMKLPIYI